MRDRVFVPGVAAIAWACRWLLLWYLLEREKFTADLRERPVRVRLDDYLAGRSFVRHCGGLSPHTAGKENHSHELTFLGRMP